MRYYEPANIRIQGDLQDFYDDKGGKRQRVISDIIEAEGPISKKMLAHKVYAAWGITRGGAKVETIFEEELAALNPNKSFSQRLFPGA